MKKPKLDKPAKEPKAPKAPKGAKQATSNAVDPEKREVFLADLRQYETANDKLTKAKEAVAKAKAQIKDDGFTFRQIKTAIQLSTPEGEAEYKMQVANDLLSAQYIGAAIGSQLSMFLEPDRTPAVDVAADEGQKDAMESKPAKPGYAPSTPQFESYMTAYHNEQGRQVKAGIKPLNSEMN